MFALACLMLPGVDVAGAPHRQSSQRHSWGAAGELGHGCPPEGDEHRSALPTPLMDRAKLEKPPSPGGRVPYLKISEKNSVQRLQCARARARATVQRSPFRRATVQHAKAVAMSRNSIPQRAQADGV